MVPALRLQLLGGFYLDYDQAPVAGLGSPRVQSLIAYLVLNRALPQPRRHLAFLFWPDSSEGQAQVNLRKLFLQLRRALPNPESYLQADGTSIQWRPEAPFSCDVVDFEDALSQVRLLGQEPIAGDAEILIEALGHYRGDLLPNCYDEWIALERERLRGRFGLAVRRLIELLEQEREYARAINWAQRLIEHDPIDESSYLLLLRLHALNGDRASALRTYHACATALERELGVEPGPAVREAYERLLTTSQEDSPNQESVTRRPESVRLVGRDREWVQLRGAWGSFARGKPKLVLLTGESGIGKTRLAEELVEWARRQGIGTATARSYPGEDSLAFAPLTTWLRSSGLAPTLASLPDFWLSEVSRLLPELLIDCPGLAPPPPLTENWQRRRFFEALVNALAHGKQALLLVVDDLHWSDRDTLEWLQFLLHNPPPIRLLVVATARDEDLEANRAAITCLQGLRDAGLVQEIAVGVLSESETALLAAGVAGHDIGPDRAAYLYRESEGNALYIVEMVRAGKLDPEHGGDTQWTAVPDPEIPPRIRAAIDARLNRLSPSAQAVASAGAILGRSFNLPLLVKISGNEDEVVGGLDELWRHRIVREHGAEEYDFVHENLRRVADSRQSLARRALLHRRAAQAIEALYFKQAEPNPGLDQASAQIAAHYDQGAMPGLAVPYYRRAAEAAHQIGANEQAIHYLRRAVSLLAVTPPVPPDARESETLAVDLLSRLGDLLGNTGRHQEAMEAYSAALQRGAFRDPLNRIRLVVKTGNLFTVQHQFDRALAAYDQAEGLLSDEPGRRGAGWQEWIQIQLERMWVYYWLSDWKKVGELSDKTRPVLDEHGTRSQQLNFNINLATQMLLRERWSGSMEATGFARKAVSISEEGNDTAEIAWARFVLGLCLLWQGGLAEAETHLQAALALAERAGDPVHQARCLTYLAILNRLRGEPGKVRELAVRADSAATRAGLIEYQGTARANQGWLLWREGKKGQADALCRAALELWEKLPPGHPSALVRWTALLPLMEIALSGGRTAEAADAARRMLAPDHQKLPDKLSVALGEGVRAWERGETDSGSLALRSAIACAKQLGYL